MSTDAIATPLGTTTERPSLPIPEPKAGGSVELLKLAAPLIVSQSFMTVQVFVDTVLLSWHDTREMTASFPAVMWFWLFFGLFQVTAGYTSTFVAQYTGSQQPHRIGPTVWQGIYFALVVGGAFLLLVPLAPGLIALGGHSDSLQLLETTYLRYLAYAGLPMLIMAAINGFFNGRGQTWTVLLIEAFGTAVNVALALLLIFGNGGLPEMGIAGAGLATVIGSWASAILALCLFLRRRHRTQFATGSGWRFERELFGRLMKFGGPAGAQVFLDVLVFHLFTQMIGRLGEEAMGATTLTVRLNMVAFLPMIGLGQAVSILVGQRLGANQPDLAERSTFTGLRWMFGYMCIVAFVYVVFPHLLVRVFAGSDMKQFEVVASIVEKLLLCVALYSLADAVNLTFAFALRGAGDTRFVSMLTFVLAWPTMVIPTFVVVWLDASIYWAWASATLYIIAMAFCFYLRFRTGKWKSMRVIETPVA